VPVSHLEQVTLSVDELEALRLADLEGLYQDQAAIRMGVSRPTFARIAEAARRKVAQALVRGQALRISGGPVAFQGRRHFRCESGHAWSLPFGTGRPPEACPSCGTGAFRRVDAGPATPGRRRRQRGRGGGARG
jgi:uncharacterized protein